MNESGVRDPVIPFFCCVRERDISTERQEKPPSSLRRKMTRRTHVAADFFRAASRMTRTSRANLETFTPRWPAPLTSADGSCQRGRRR